MSNFYYAPDEIAMLKAALASLQARLAEAEELLRRLSAWDHMDTAGDGPFWREQIRAALKPGEGKP